MEALYPMLRPVLIDGFNADGSVHRIFNADGKVHRSNTTSVRSDAAQEETATSRNLSEAQKYYRDRRNRLRGWTDAEKRYLKTSLRPSLLRRLGFQFEWDEDEVEEDGGNDDSNNVGIEEEGGDFEESGATKRANVWTSGGSDRTASMRQTWLDLL